jgi:DNA modification methylase
MVNPKRKFDKKNTTPVWYDYYAGYSDNFLIKTLEYFNLDKKAVILDPWNGTGTTTFQASACGYSSIGIDINPALIIISKARNLDRNILQSIDTLTLDILKKSEASYIIIPKDSFELWFSTKTASFMRSIERSIYKLLVSYNDNHITDLLSLDCVSNLACFFYSSLFQTVKSYLKGFATTNPTWIKTAKSKDELLDISFEDIKQNFLLQIKKSATYIQSTTTVGDKTCDIRLGKSENLNLDSNSIDAVITSPPYCTRIDYAIATLPELVTLGYKKDKNFKNFRDSITGTPTIYNKSILANKLWGDTCLGFISSVSKHESKASRTYYLDYYLQYFHNMYQSAEEITRVCKPDAMLAIVTQDSYYKDVHVNLSSIVEDFFTINGWEQTTKQPFITEQTMTKFNKETKKYRKTTEATETVSIFKKRK